MYNETLLYVPANEKITAYLKAEGFEYEEYEDNTYGIITAKYDLYNGVDDLIAILIPMIGTDCVIDGFYDYAGYSGSTSKFRFVYEGGVLRQYQSEWYTDLSMSWIEDYEEFCDEYGDQFTEEEYELFCNGEYFLFDDGSYYTMDEIPMTEVL